jgi:tRNA pseudouridine55 synthase
MEGFINLNKPAGPTSHDMVDLVRRLLHHRRVGHGGTLDPLAQGVLPIGVGRATRLLRFLLHADKVYRAHIRLGVSTTTYDAEGAITAERPVPSLERTDLEQTLAPFLGEIEQVPPPYSAIRQDGQRLFQRARAGEVVSPQPRRVRILRLEVLAWEHPSLHLEVTCGRGTYIRALAHDLGERLGCGAHLAGLLRLRVGPFHLENALPPQSLERALQEGPAENVLLPLDLPVRHWPAVEVDEEQARRLANGRPLSLPPGAVPTGEERAWAREPAGRLLALLRFEQDSGQWHPFRVFPRLD